jgi:hypothetical protein
MCTQGVAKRCRDARRKTRPRSILDPNIGRFVSEDPLGLKAGINPYVFANNDPINGSDPSGMDADRTCSNVTTFQAISAEDRTLVSVTTTECHESGGEGNNAVGIVGNRGSGYGSGAPNYGAGGGSGNQSAQPPTPTVRPTCVAAGMKLPRFDGRLNKPDIQAGGVRWEKQRGLPERATWASESGALGRHTHCSHVRRSAVCGEWVCCMDIVGYV